MASELIIQNLFSSVNRSLRPVFRRWLSSVELARRREEQILIYLERTAEPAVRARVVGALSPCARALLANVIRYAEQATAGEILAVTAAGGHNVSPTTLGELHYHGLAFMEDSKYWPAVNAEWTEDHAREEVVFPPALGSERIAFPEPEARPDMFTGRVSVVSEMDEAPITALLTEFLDSISTGSMRLTQHGKLTSRSRKAMSGAWDEYAEAALCTPEHMLAFGLGADIVRTDSTGAIIIERGFASFRRKPHAQQVKEFLDFSVANIEIENDELTQYGFSPRRFALQMMCTILSITDRDTWLQVKHMVATVARRATAMFTPQQGIRGWHWANSRRRLPSRARWNSLCRKLLEQWFAPAGVIQWGVTPKKSPCVRTTPLGRFWLLGERAPAHKNQHQQLVVQPDFTALLTHSGPWDRTAQVLGLFASRTGDDNASVFRFSRESVQAAVRQGHKIEEILTFLDERCTYPVPENVRHSVEEWSSLSARVTLFRDVNMFTFESRAERDCFISDVEHTAKPIGERHALLLGTEDRALDIMKRIHATPVDYTDSPIGGLEVRPDGMVVCHAPDDLRVIALCNAIAEPAGEAGAGHPRAGHYYLSARAMRRAPFPVRLYDRLVQMPGRPLPLNVRLNILIGMGLLEKTDDNRYAVLAGFAFSKKSALKKAFDWRKTVLARIARDAFVILPGSAETVKKVLASAGVEGRVDIVTVEELPMCPGEG